MICPKCGTIHDTESCPFGCGFYAKDPIVVGPPPMTLRDYFAGLAMQGDIVPSELDCLRQESMDSIAQAAYKLADAMMKAREKHEADARWPMWVCDECWDSSKNEVLTLGGLVPDYCENCHNPAGDKGLNAVWSDWLDRKNGKHKTP